MDNNIPTSEDDLPLLPSEPPEQDLSRFPNWEYSERKNPRWGEVTKKGLIIGRGPRQRVIPPDEVYKLAEIGCNDREIAEWFMIDENTLRYNFSAFMTKARAGLKRRLRAVQLDVALKGNAVMLIWLGKNLLGQSDNPVNSLDNESLPWND
jgi:hypothetical protein